MGYRLFREPLPKYGFGVFVVGCKREVDSGGRVVWGDRGQVMRVETVGMYSK